MNINFQRTIDRLVGVPLCVLFSLLHRVRQPEPLTGPPRRVLVILLSEMGSLVLGRAMFARLKEKYPNAEIYALLFARSREVLDLLDVIPKEKVLTVNDRSLKQFGRDCFNVLRTARALNFDVVIDCELFARVSSIFVSVGCAGARGISPVHAGGSLSWLVPQSAGAL